MTGSHTPASMAQIFTYDHKNAIITEALMMVTEKIETGLPPYPYRVTAAPGCHAPPLPAPMPGCRRISRSMIRSGTQSGKHRHPPPSAVVTGASGAGQPVRPSPSGPDERVGELPRRSRVRRRVGDRHPVLDRSPGHSGSDRRKSAGTPDGRSRFGARRHAPPSRGRSPAATGCTGALVLRPRSGIECIVDPARLEERQKEDRAIADDDLPGRGADAITRPGSQVAGTTLFLPTDIDGGNRGTPMLRDRRAQPARRYSARSAAPYASRFFVGI